MVEANFPCIMPIWTPQAKMRLQKSGHFFPDLWFPLAQFEGKHPEQAKSRPDQAQSGPVRSQDQVRSDWNQA